MRSLRSDFIHIKGTYRIIEKIDEGSFGKIYKGVNIHTQEHIAIKLVRFLLIYLI